MEEVWKPIPGYEGYEVSNMGNVRSYRIKGKQGKFSNTPRILRPAIDKKSGYYGVGLGKGVFKRVHQLVLLAFIGPRPDKLFALHNDDDKSNNKLDNLRYDTQKANIEDMVKNHNGIFPTKKYTVKQATRIYTSRDKLIEAYETSETVKEVSQKLGVKSKTVMECASRLRRLGFDVPKFAQGKPPKKDNPRAMSKIRLLQILLAWESGELDKAQVSRFLRMDIAEIRSLKEDAIRIGKELVL